MDTKVRPAVTGPRSTLRARLRRAGQRHPGWHIWASTSGHIYAAGRNTADPLLQATVDAPTTRLIGRAIAAHEATRRAA